MSHVIEEIKASLFDRDAWVRIGIAAMLLLLPAAGVLRWAFPDAQQPKQLPWGEWYAVVAYYEPQRHRVVITSRAWIMRVPCTEADLNRNVFIVDDQRAVHVFETAGGAPVINDQGAHVSEDDIVIPLTDSAGNRLHIRPERARIALTCGTRPPMMSEDLPLTIGPLWK